jgi:hypothetical protein
MYQIMVYKNGDSIYLVFREVLGIVGVAVESGQDFDEALTNVSVFTLCTGAHERGDVPGNGR